MFVLESLKLSNLLLSWQKGLCRCDYTKDVEEIVLDYADGPSVITRALLRGRQKCQSQRASFEDGMLLALMTEKVATSQRMKLSKASTWILP